MRLEQLGLLGGEQHGAQALQRAHRPVAGLLERLVERGLDGFERRQAGRKHRRVFERHRRVVGEAHAVEAIDRRARVEPQRQRFFRRHRARGRLSHTLRGLRPRARMSSENEVSFAKFFSTRAHDESARALAAHEQPFVDQPVDRLAHRDARHGELVGEIALRRQGVVGTEDPLLDGRRAAHAAAAGTAAVRCLVERSQMSESA